LKHVAAAKLHCHAEKTGLQQGLLYGIGKKKKGKPETLLTSPPPSSSSPYRPRTFHLKKKQTKEEEDSHRTGTSQRDASVLSVFWVSEKALGVDLENGESREEASLLLPLALSL
jgi:hypothetical protein